MPLLLQNGLRVIERHEQLSEEEERGTGTILGRTLGTCTVANSRSPSPFFLLKLMISEEGIYRIDGPLDLTFLMKMYSLEGFERLKNEKYMPQPVPELPAGEESYQTVNHMASRFFQFPCPYDIILLVKMLSGYSEPLTWNKLSLAPLWLKKKFIHLIEREKQHAMEGNPAHIIAKMNSLCDKDVMEALYDASAQGVKIGLSTFS